MSVATALAERAWCVVVPYHARGARLARHRIAGELAGAVGSELLADAVAVAAELVGNAIRHAKPLPGNVIRVAWRISTVAPGVPPLAGPAAAAIDCRQVVEVRVTDGGAGIGPQQRSVGPDSVDGRGLCIVAALADRWGVDRDGLGQSVWAELSGPPHD
jgi:anti-sigma regulatory factor (Ser/Thr protein kinase)